MRKKLHTVSFRIKENANWSWSSRFTFREVYAPGSGHSLICAGRVERVQHVNNTPIMHGG